MELEHFKQLLQKVKPSGRDRWRCQCPSHGSSKDAMMFDLKPDGYICVYCFAGCSKDDILSAMGIQEKDLFTRNTDDYDRAGYEIRKINEELVLERMIVLINESNRHRYNGHKGAKQDDVRYIEAKKRIRLGEKRMRELQRCQRR